MKQCSLVAGLLVFLLSATASAERPTTSSAEQLLRRVFEKRGGCFHVEAVKLSPGGAERQTFIERVIQQGRMSFLTELFDEQGKLFWTSYWTVSEGKKPTEIRLVERWATGEVVTYEATFTGNLLSAEGKQPNGTRVSFRSRFSGATIFYHREETRDGQLVAVRHERLSPVRPDRAPLSRR